MPRCRATTSRAPQVVAVRFVEMIVLLVSFMSTTVLGDTCLMIESGRENTVDIATPTTFTNCDWSDALVDFRVLTSDIILTFDGVRLDRGSIRIVPYVAADPFTLRGPRFE